MGNNEYSSDKRSHRRSKEIKADDAIGTLSSGETALHIPKEIIEEILVRLPVKSLLKFKCVAKSWLALISSPKFIKAHLTYSTNLDPTISNRRLMLSISYGPLHNNKSYYLVSFVLRDFWTDVVDDADCSNNKTEQQFSIRSSCNGLLCVSEYYLSKLKDVFLWNPCLRMSKKLPPPLCAAEWSKIWLSKHCIVYDECNDDYKVVGLLLLHEYGSPMVSKVEIYSLKNDSWKRIEDFKGGRFPYSFMVYANGKIHFVETSNGGLSIVSFDLENEVYGTVEHLEVEQQGCYSSLSVGALKGCICALYSYTRDRADVWILKEYGVKESWTKLVSIPYVDGPASVHNHFYLSYCLLFMWNGKYLLSRGSRVVVYDPRDSSFIYHSLTKDQIVGDILSGSIYVESLVPLSRNEKFGSASRDKAVKEIMR